jgi:hypothetical protein
MHFHGRNDALGNPCCAQIAATEGTVTASELIGTRK